MHVAPNLHYLLCMPKVVQVREVPDAVHEELIRQAKAAGLSLNRFVLAELERVARRGRSTQVLKRAARRRGRRLSSAQIVEAVRDDRDRSR